MMIRRGYIRTLLSSALLVLIIRSGALVNPVVAGDIAHLYNALSVPPATRRQHTSTTAFQICCRRTTSDESGGGAVYSIIGSWR